MTIRLLGATSPIYMIGESHAIKFGNLLFDTPWSNDLFLCTTKFFPALFAQDYLQDDGAYNPMLSDALHAEGVLLSGQPHYLIREESAAYMSGTPQLSPVLVFFAGDMDMQTLFFALGEQHDFELPGDDRYGVDYDKSPIAYDIVHDQVKTRLGSFIRAMGVARAQFSRVMVHALPPRCRDDERARRWSRGTLASAALRSKIIVTANRVLDEACAGLDIPFIDTWDQISADGYLRPEYDLDGLHTTRDAAMFSLEAIADVLYDRTASVANPNRYLGLEILATTYDGPVHGGAAAWTDAGFVLADLDLGGGAAAIDDLDFVADAPNAKARLDWVGYPRAGRPGIAAAEPTVATLEWAAGLFGTGEPRSLLQMGQTKSLTIVTFRPIELAAGVRAPLSILPTPPGCRRAALCLTSSGTIGLETLAGESIGHAEARPGRIIVYDPARTRLHATAGGEPMRLVEMSLAPCLRGHPFRVIGAGLNDWPADPFHYSVAGMNSFPPIGGPMIYERA